VRVTGRTLPRNVGGEEVATFVPNPLPPREPALVVDSNRGALLARAEQALARLEVAGEMVPSVDWFIYAFVRKEAVGFLADRGHPGNTCRSTGVRGGGRPPARGGRARGV
jgi:hypothetical protein